MSTSPTSVSARLGDTLLAESRSAVVLEEPGYPPRYYFPRLDVKMTLLERSERTTSCPHKGTAEYFHLKSGDGQSRDVAWSYKAPLLQVAEISGYIAFYDDGSGITVA